MKAVALTDKMIKNLILVLRAARRQTEKERMYLEKIRTKLEATLKGKRK